MRGTDFPESTTDLGAPEGMEEEVYPLRVWKVQGHPAYISKWRMSWRERLSCLFRGHVWLHVMSHQHPPVAIETHYPFDETVDSGSLALRYPLIATALLVAFAALGFLSIYYWELY